MFEVGDIVKIFAPQAGKEKYHLCILVGLDGAASQFLYLNSNPHFSHTYVVDCNQVPCIPASDTGKTAFSFAMLPRYSDNQLKLYKASKLGSLSQELAKELHNYALTVPTLNSPDRKIVVAALKTVAKL